MEYGCTGCMICANFDALTLTLCAMQISLVIPESPSRPRLASGTLPIDTLPNDPDPVLDVKLCLL